MSIDELLRQIDAATAPPMSKEQAKAGASALPRSGVMGPVVTPEYMIELSGELVRRLCMVVCDEVAAISGWDGDPTDTEKRYKAGVSNTCEEIKYRIEHMDLTASLRNQAPVAGISDD